MPEQSTIAREVWVVSPTYNERDNITTLADRVLAFPGFHLLIVDDNSPDGTGQLADQMAAKDPRISVLHRANKTGFGTAYRDGFRWALEEGAETIIQMDADLSHDPSLIPVMLAALTESDLVLGSRYVPGGSMAIDPWRQWISSIGNMYVRLMLGTSVHDWSTGYKAWRTEFLRRVLAQPIRSVGYAWLMETSWLALRLGGRITEVPLKFQERLSGESKFNLSIAAEDIRRAWELRRSGNQPLAKG